MVLSWIDGSFYYKGDFVLEKLKLGVSLVRPVAGFPDKFYQNVLKDRYMLKGEFLTNYREVFRV